MCQQNTKYLSPKQAAEKTGTTTPVIMRMIRSGKIKAEKVGWVWTIPVKETITIKKLIENK